MPDPLYLSLWFRGSETEDLLTHALAVMTQFPFSASRPGITYLALHPVSWEEPTILERRFDPGVPPEEAVQAASDLLHDDYAYVFEASWDLWTPSQAGPQWALRPVPVKFVVRGPEFEQNESETQGNIEIEFGLDTPFLHEEMHLTPDAEAGVRDNVQKLVELTIRLEKNSGATARLLWSESEENLAQKLISRLQKIQ
ncbi:MAG TPA: hypothetical protein VLV49_08245 [Terriglobales bacterium]|nr:hypothetical protein [Terriglobales bacterium]